MNEANTVLEEVMASGGDMREDEARSILGSFLFRRTDVHKKVSVLSGSAPPSTWSSSWSTRPTSY